MAGETKQAKEAIATSLQKSENSALYLNNMMLCYKLLADINTKETDFEEANKSLRNYYVYKDSLEALHEKSKITELYLSFAESSKEKEIKATKYNENLVRSINRVILIGSAFVVLMLILYLRLLSDRNLRKSAVQEQRLEMAKKEADLNKKLLMEFQLRLSERNATLLTMPLNESDELDQKSIDDLNESETTEDSNPSTGFLENIKILTADDWERFVSLYDIALPGVIGKVHTKFPNLTAGEQRIFLLLKLDVETREIAAMLGISPESVRKSKYRLRKKLSIPDGMSIENFIKQGI